FTFHFILMTKRRQKQDVISPSVTNSLSSSGENEEQMSKKICLNPCIRLTKSFFSTDYLKVCREILGKILVRRYFDSETQETTLLKGRIVEVEAYPGGTDKASHSYNGKKTVRNEAMYMSPGTYYVYYIHGRQCCLNISTQGEGTAVLIRALEPLEGIEQMKRNRLKTSLERKRKNDEDKKKNSTPLWATKNDLLCKGPCCMCSAMGITKTDHNQKHMDSDNIDLWFESDHLILNDDQIGTSTRVGIDSSGEESVKKQWRFFIQNSPYVSGKKTIIQMKTTITTTTTTTSKYFDKMN
ncbi:unnamed protein product, partial [Didymodactylos carnosus]